MSLARDRAERGLPVKIWLMIYKVTSLLTQIKLASARLGLHCGGVQSLSSKSGWSADLAVTAAQALEDIPELLVYHVLPLQPCSRIRA